MVLLEKSSSRGLVAKEDLSAIKAEGWLYLARSAHIWVKEYTTIVLVPKCGDCHWAGYTTDDDALMRLLEQLETSEDAGRQVLPNLDFEAARVRVMDCAAMARALSTSQEVFQVFPQKPPL